MEQDMRYGYEEKFRRMQEEIDFDTSTIYEIRPEEVSKIEDGRQIILYFRYYRTYEIRMQFILRKHR